MKMKLESKKKAFKDKHQAKENANKLQLLAD